MIPLLIATFLCSPVPTSANACTCVSTGSVKAQARAALKYADAVFAGLVVRIDSTSAPYFTDHPGTLGVFRRATIVPTHRWKGVLSDTVEVWTVSSDAMCGFPFRVGQSYLVVANQGEAGRLDTGLCSLTQSLEGAALYVRALGKPRVPHNTVTPN